MILCNEIPVLIGIPAAYFFAIGQLAKTTMAMHRSTRKFPFLLIFSGQFMPNLVSNNYNTGKAFLWAKVSYQERILLFCSYSTHNISDLKSSAFQACRWRESLRDKNEIRHCGLVKK